MRHPFKIPPCQRPAAFRAALAALFAVLCVAHEARAQSSPLTIGQPCGALDGTLNTYNVNLACPSGTWVYHPLQMGASPDACNAAEAGEMEWTGSSFQGCTGTAWVPFLGGAGGVLATGNGGTGTGTTFTQGSVVFAGASGIYAQDNAQLFWDDTNHRFGIGVAVPSQALTVAGNIDITGANGYLTEISNDGTTGTTASKLAKLTASGAAIIAATADTDGMIGVVTGGAGTTGNAQVAVDGQASCVFDGATTAGHFVAISATTAGDCHDAGAARSATSQTIGRVLSTNGSSGTYTVELGLNAASSGAISGSGTTNYVARWTPNGSTLGIGTLYDTGTLVGIGTTGPAAALDVYTSAGIGAIDLGGQNGISYPASDTTAGGSIAIGVGALAHQPASAAYGNTAVGYHTLNSASMTTAAIQNTALGYLALPVDTSGSANVAIGQHALLNNTTGSNNTAIGQGTLYFNTAGTFNVAIGDGALADNSTTGGNVAVGFNALGNETGGLGNTATGTYTLYYDTTGSDNTAFGYGALAVTTGSSNTALGYGVAGSTFLTGSNNILIGTSSAVNTPAANTSHFLDIGNTIFATSTMTGTVAAPAGSVGIDTTTPQATLDVNGYARLALNSSAPAACAAANEGAIALTHLAQVCVCDTTPAWNVLNTGTACSW